MTFMEIESLVSKSQIKNDFEYGYQDGMNNKAKKENSTKLYYEGYEFGSKFKGER